MDSATIRELTKSVSSYFLNYLETDFKKQQTPGRRLQLQREGGLRVGLSLSRYAPLNAAFWSTLACPAPDLEPIVVSRRAFTTTLTDRFRDAVVKAVRGVPEEVYALVRQQVVGCAESTRAESEYADTWVTEMFRSAAQEICERIVHPLLATLDPFLRRDAQALLETTYDLEGELTNILLQPLTDDFSTALYTMASAGKTDDLWDVLTRLFTRDHSQSILIDYFETFATADAYVDVKQMVSSMKSRENMELYLYLGVLQFRKNTFPLFYIPITVDMEEETTKFRLSLKPQVLVYKRAVDYILQETNSRTEATSPISERILYATGDDTLQSLLKIPTTQVLSALRLPPEFRISSEQKEAVDTPNYSIESSLHLAVYDKSDESLLNDYEELLTAARGSGGPMLDLFESMVKAVVMEDPVSVDKSVGDDWEALNIAERLVHACPIPINEEQSKIIAALKQPNCRFVSVEGPPGTGKSHTISAIAFDAILSKKSVLLLSDKREALDVVEDKLEQTLASVRPSGLDFPNPILRLGKEGNNFRRLLQGSTVQQISDYNRAARTKEAAVKSELTAGVTGLKNELHQTADALSAIQLKHIQELHQLEAQIDTIAPGASDDIRTFLSRTYDSKLVSALAELGPEPEAHLTSMLQDMPDTDLKQIRRKSEIYEYTLKLCKEVNCAALRRFHHLTLEDGPRLSARADQIGKLKRPFIGYLFRKAPLAQLSQQLNTEFSPRTTFQIPSELSQIREVAGLLTNIEGRCRVSAQGQGNTVVEIILSPDGGVGIGSLGPVLREFSNLFKDRLTERLSYRHSVFASAGDYAKFLLKTIRYAGGFQALTAEFGKLPEMDFIGSRTRIEQLYSTQMDTAPIKMFVGIRVPLDIAASLTDFSSYYPNPFPDVRWTETDDIHITLRFLGPQTAPLATAINDGLARISHPQVNIILSGAGVFEDVGVLFVSIAPVPGLMRLQQAVDLAEQIAGGLLLSLRSASGEALARRRAPGVSAESGAVDADSSAPRGAAPGEAGPTTFRRDKPVSRRAAFAALLFAKSAPRCQKVRPSSRLEGGWYCIRPQVGRRGQFPPLHPSHGESNLKGGLDGQDRIRSSPDAHGD